MEIKCRRKWAGFLKMKAASRNKSVLYRGSIFSCVLIFTHLNILRNLCGEHPLKDKQRCHSAPWCRISFCRALQLITHSAQKINTVMSDNFLLPGRDIWALAFKTTPSWATSPVHQKKCLYRHPPVPSSLWDLIKALQQLSLGRKYYTRTFYSGPMFIHYLD